MTVANPIFSTHLSATMEAVHNDLRTALHCHGCGEFLPFGANRIHGEVCSKACWDTRLSAKSCMLMETFGSCSWCDDTTFQPFQHSVSPAAAADIRMMRALDAFLLENDSLPYQEQYWFEKREYCLFAQDPAKFIAKWYWLYVFGCQPRNGTLPAPWHTYQAFMPLERRAENARWPFYESCFS